LGTGIPDFLIVGAMRSGTTSLYRYLGAHPEVFVLPKEFQFFTKHWSRGLEWYADQFPRSAEGLTLGEATADYFARESAMTHISAAVPGVQLIASLRNPIERAWSHYGLLSERGQEPRSFSAAIDDEIALYSEAGATAEGLIYLGHSMYDHHLERCFGLFDRDQLHVIVFEDLKERPGPVYAELCRYLGIDDRFVPEKLGQPVNQYVTFRSLRVRKLTQSLPAGPARLLGRLNTRRDLAPDIPRDVRDRLREFFLPHVERIEDLLDRPLDRWDF